MTPTLDASEQYPEMPEGYYTDWHMVNDLLKVEVRQLSDDTFQLKSPTHSITINREGFDLYRDGSVAGQAIFDDWCLRNKIVPVAHPTESSDGE